MAVFETKLNSIIAAHTSYKENRTLARIYAKQHHSLLDELMAMARKIARNLRMREDMEPKDLETFGFTVLESTSVDVSTEVENEEENEDDLDQAS